MRIFRGISKFCSIGNKSFYHLQLKDVTNHLQCNKNICHRIAQFENCISRKGLFSMRLVVHYRYFSSDTNSDFIGVNDYTKRTHNCGELRAFDIGKEVKLCGWVEFYRMNKFIILRDAYGSTQIICDKLCKSVPPNVYLETVISISGVVQPRPKSQVVKHLKTGEIEISATSVLILNEAIPNLPFHIRSRNKATRNTQNRHRYLALRFAEFQYNLRLRSKIIHEMRKFLIEKKKFLEVETPTLFKKTPGGSQEFVVPTREKDKFYSLVQSPQQLKQLLMVGSIDRYFQIARCYRDERTEADRQPEFTQLDIELSFTSVDDVIKLTEDVLLASWPQCKGQLATPFPRIRHEDALNKYGSDKPCILDEFLVQDIGDYTETDRSNYMYMIVVPDGQHLYERLASYSEILMEENSTKIYLFKVTQDFNLCNQFEKNFTTFQRSLFEKQICVNTGDLIIVGRGCERTRTLKTVGQCRRFVINELNLTQIMNEQCKYDFIWVVDFPLFEKGENGQLMSAHHPFTHPAPDDWNSSSDDYSEVRSLAYDLVLNGSEIGGGSIRIHDVKLQKKIFEILNLSKDNFSHLLKALQMGCPPHGGIALGIDRIVAILCNCKTIKDVIAFPKGSAGQDYMTECPSDIPFEDKIRYHLQ